MCPLAWRRASRAEAVLAVLGTPRLLDKTLEPSVELRSAESTGFGQENGCCSGSLPYPGLFLHSWGEMGVLPDLSLSHPCDGAKKFLGGLGRS